MTESSRTPGERLVCATAKETATAHDDFLARILDPTATAVLTMELQEGVVGSGALFPALVDEVQRRGVVNAVRRLCGAARDSGAPVVHCTAVTRTDGVGGAENCKVFALNARLRRERGTTPTQLGTPGAELVEGLQDPRDIVVSRLHGMTPFTSTALDQILRNLGVRTVVITGVSVNLGVIGAALTAVDLGYQVVVVRDGVAGVPADYAQAVMDNSMSLIATLVDTDDVLAVWKD